MKNFNIMLMGKLQKYEPYDQAKLINMNILHVKKFYLLIKNKQQNKLNPLKNKLNNK